MKKKILVWETLSTVSGGQKMTLAVMDILRDEYEFCCLIPCEGSLSHEFDSRGIPYICIGDQSMPAGIKGKSVIFKYAAMSLRCIMRSLKAIRRYKPDILYASGPAALPWSAICGTLAGKPVIWHLHHNFEDGMTLKLLRMCAKRKCVKRIIAVSDCVASQTADAVPNKTVTVYNPVDAVKYSSGDGEIIRSEFSELLADDPVVISHIALVQRTKKQDFVLRVIAELKNSGINTVGLFLGEVRDLEFMNELNALAGEYGIEENVRFTGKRDDIPDFLRITDAIILPSTEGFPLAGLEAASAGVPAAVCSTAGALEYVQISGCGIPFENDDPESAANAVRAIIAKRDILSEKGRAFADKCSVDKYGSAIREIFGDVK